jgi:ABC-type antimicrobial peptide transport system permease subunit
MFSYAVKRVIRSLGLFAALLLGVILASTFFAGINIGADTTAKAALNQQLDLVPVDIVIKESGSQTSRSTVWTAAASKVANVTGIIGADVISRAYSYGDTTFENNTSFRIVGVSNMSNVSPFYDGVTVTSGASSLGENETYVWIDSKNVGNIELNSTISLNFTFSYRSEDTYMWTEKSVSISLKVVGFVELDDKAYSIATGDIYGSTIYGSTQDQSYSTKGEDLLIVNWTETCPKLLDVVPSNVRYYNSPFTTQILAYINRDALVNPWDIQGSLTAVDAITVQANQAVARYGMNVTNNISQILMSYQGNSMSMRFYFLAVALPVFFVAWYVGTTVSDVSYNLRRREIGLLLTKGFSSGQLFRMFLTESFMIGIIGGLIGVGLGFLFSPLFATVVGGELGATPVLSQEVIIITIIFSLAITLLSTFRPSRRASQLPPVDALREYMYVEGVKPYRQRWPWVAFSLGLYKIIMFLLGINLAQMFYGGSVPFTNVFLVILFGIWLMIDSVLTYIGPLLFFWGFTKIFIRGSLKFQELVTRAARFLGDLGTLATKNVQRNPARTASVAFLIALIVGYSFQTIGAVASEQDYITRQVKANVGADISAQLTSATNASSIANRIEDELSGVASATFEYSFSGTLPGQYYSGQIRAVDPDKWLSTAYYETEWFSGNDVATAFQQMRTSNRTIILERNLAKSLGKNVGSNVTLTIGGSTLELEIVGFFGSEVPQQQYYIQPYAYIIGTFWSYVPVGLYESLGGSLSPSTRVLVKLEPGADGKSVASEILNFDSVSYVSSVAEDLETRQSNLTLSGSLNIQRIGVVFSILAASVATGLAALVSLQERKREASIMSARGLSFKQLVTMLLAENLAVVVFAAVLGIVVGLIVVRGNVAAANASMSYSLVTHQMVFPLDAIMLLSTCVALVFAATIIPVILLTKRYISQIERIVRL